MHFSANIAVEQEVIVAVIVIALFYIYTLLMYTNTTFRVATLTPEVDLQNLRACRRGSCPILERLVELRN